MRYIESDDNLSLRGDALQVAIDDDIKLGLIPFWVSCICQCLSSVKTVYYIIPDTELNGQTYFLILMAAKYILYNEFTVTFTYYLP